MRAISHYSASISSSSNIDAQFHPKLNRGKCSIRRALSPKRLLCVLEAVTAGSGAERNRRVLPTAPSAAGIHIAKSTYGNTIVYGLSPRKSDTEQELFGLTAADVRKLTAKIKQAQTWRELKELLQNKTALQAMDAICFSTAFASLARMSRGNAARLSAMSQKEVNICFQSLLQLVRPKMVDMDAQGLASLAASLAKMEHDNLGLMEEVLAYSEELMPEFSPQALANLIWALATANHQPSGAWLTEYYRRVEDQADVLNSQDIANIMYGLAKLDLMPDVWLMDALVRRSLLAIREQDSVSGQDPATLIQCMARFYYKYNFRVCDEWLKEYISIVQPNLAAYMPFDLVSILHSLVVMNYMPYRAFMAEYYMVIKDRLITDPALSYTDFQRLMWALSRVDFTPNQSWQREFLKLSAPKLRHLKPRALSELMWTLSHWGCNPSKEWLSVFFSVTRPKLNDFKPPYLANLLSALARMGCQAEGVWMDAALKSFQDQVQYVKAHDLVTMIDTLTVVSKGDWLASQSRAIYSLAEIASAKFSFYDLGMHSKLACALATANIRPGVAWLRKQKKAVAVCLGEDPTDSQEATRELHEVYRSWDSDLEVL